MSKLKVVLVASEVVPFAKTGGLADVAGSLPLALESLNCQVSVFLPYYRQARSPQLAVEPLKKKMSVALGNRDIGFSLRICKRKGVDFYFIDRDEYFDREFLYGTAKGDYPDSGLRFAFFVRAVLDSMQDLALEPDIIHCHDWQSALLPFYLRHRRQEFGSLNSAKVLFTVHNLAYQGIFPKELIPQIDIGLEFFTPEALEFYGNLSFIKSGILYSDAVSTVSKGYAREILSKEYGCGLEGLLATRRNALYGILNGADYADWNPATDKLIKVNYDRNSLAGKRLCKKDLLSQMRLKADLDMPLLGVVTRLAEQKGIDIIVNSLPQLIKRGCGLVILGQGDEKYHRLLNELSRKYPKNLAVKIAFDNQLAHKIEAGCDIFLMPSRYEPCGLNQIYSLKYATIPVVRATGGLDDTITDYSEDQANGNGFKFDQVSVDDFIAALSRALRVYKDKHKWQALMLKAMACDFSWRKSAAAYINLYRQMRSGAKTE